MKTISINTLAFRKDSLVELNRQEVRVVDGGLYVLGKYNIYDPTLVGDTIICTLPPDNPTTGSIYFPTGQIN